MAGIASPDVSNALLIYDRNSFCQAFLAVDLITINVQSPIGNAGEQTRSLATEFPSLHKFLTSTHTDQQASLDRHGLTDQRGGRARATGRLTARFSRLVGDVVRGGRKPGTRP
jgi:hypothetical protein